MDFVNLMILPVFVLFTPLWRTLLVNGGHNGTTFAHQTKDEHYINIDINEVDPTLLRDKCE